MYAEQITEAMEKAIAETNRRRKIQKAFNKKHNLVPVTIENQLKKISLLKSLKMAMILLKENKKELLNQVNEVERLMKNAAKELDFERAAELRDLLFELKAHLKI